MEIEEGTVIKRGDSVCAVTDGIKEKLLENAQIVGNQLMKMGKQSEGVIGLHVPVRNVVLARAMITAEF